MACENTIDCPCTYSYCSNHGKCCDCIAYHKSLGEAPACLFSTEGEKTYDRSIEFLYRDYMKNK